MKLYLIRHGRQSSQKCNVDVELSEEGRRQADLLGRRLAGYGIDALYSSKLIRAYETAEIANQYLHLEHKIKPEIREICFGDFEGRDDADNKRDFGDFIAHNALGIEDLPYPNGENGEAVFTRGIKALKEIVAECEEAGCEKIAIVTHGVFIRCILAGLYTDNFAKKEYFGRCMENTSITEFLYQKEYDRFCLERFNDYAHLEATPELLRAAWNKVKF